MNDSVENPIFENCFKSSKKVKAKDIIKTEKGKRTTLKRLEKVDSSVISDQTTDDDIFDISCKLNGVSPSSDQSTKMAALKKFNEAKHNLKEAAQKFYEAKAELDKVFNPSKGGKSRKSRKNRSRK